jgi:pyruvate dehydrogenase E1 component beta subunit
VIAEQNKPFCGVGAEVAFQIQRDIFDELDAPVLRVAQEEVPMPYNEALEAAVLPSKEKIVEAVYQVCYL